ncbi:MAG: hypothetical protein QM791_10050 [Ferruginibacter sp.]
MNTANTKSKGVGKKILTAVLVALVAGGAVAWYLFTKKFDDTAAAKADYTVNALEFMQEFHKDISSANKKYTEKIVTVNGRIAQVEAADTTINLKMIDTTTGDYVIFAFQQQDMPAAKQVKTGDSVSVKGSCSGGLYSDILETGYITFKRCSLNK